MNSKTDMINNIVNAESSSSMEIPPTNTPAAPPLVNDTTTTTTTTNTESKWVKVKNALVHPVGIFCLTFIIVFIALIIAKPPFVTKIDEEDENKEKANMALISVISVLGAGVVVAVVMYVKKRFFSNGN